MPPARAACAHHLKEARKDRSLDKSSSHSQRRKREPENHTTGRHLGMQLSPEREGDGLVRILDTNEKNVKKWPKLPFLFPKRKHRKEQQDHDASSGSNGSS